ncbi:CLUMA_CG005541, isoform A [Clunio marinus]|uniref:CLUMA_CG005541, isoform A n=1 Tax=Clunio marinus TaxID=568069 RepID=A0A1J1I0K7_9DIPT|nr:CLUMA_CG005541, isoform A [Clunio marinus]
MNDELLGKTLCLFSCKPDGMNFEFLTFCSPSAKMAAQHENHFSHSVHPVERKFHITHIFTTFNPQCQALLRCFKTVTAQTFNPNLCLSRPTLNFCSFIDFLL